MTQTKKLPREKGIDNTLNVLKDGYQYILKRSKQLNSDVFETRLLGQKAICMVGEEASEIFHDVEKFKREDASPNRIVQTLFGEGGVQSLNGQAHRHRKKMFMSIMTPETLEELNNILVTQWDLAADEWTEKDQVLLYEEIQEILTRTATQWAGVPVKEKEINKLTKDLSALFESPAAFGPQHWQGRMARNRLEKWMQGIISDVRNEKIHPPKQTALHTFSWHRDLEGNLLDEEIAAVEVINILRPIVAISIFVNFLALALHDFPGEKKKLKGEDEKYMEMFIQEVRRYYPFFPFSVAIVKESFIWNDFKFEEGTLTLLDLYGTNHHSKTWEEPKRFNPERFLEWKESPFSFIPQGGGDYFLGHRCAGEWVTLDIMKQSLNYLLNKLEYDLPEQDLNLSKNKIPNIPDSKIKLKNIKKVSS